MQTGPSDGPKYSLVPFWDHLGPICGPISERDLNHRSVYTLTNWSSRVPRRQKTMQTGPSVGPKYILGPFWDHLGPICGPISERDLNNSSVYTLTNWSSRVPLRQKNMQTEPSMGPKYIFGTILGPFGSNLWANFRKGPSIPLLTVQFTL